jgi:hypothetical protein
MAFDAGTFYVVASVTACSSASGRNGFWSTLAAPSLDAIAR